MTAITDTFNIPPRARVAVIIDGAHLFSITKSIGFDLDFEKLRLLLSSAFDVRRISYLLRVAFNPQGEIISPGIEKLLDYLRHNGYRIITEQLQDFTDGTGRRVVRNSVDGIIAATMLTAALSDIREIILIAGSDELIPIIEACSQKDVRVTLVSSVKAMSQSVTSELCATADWFVEITDLRERVTRSNADSGSIGARARIISRTS